MTPDLLTELQRATLERQNRENERARAFALILEKLRESNAPNAEILAAVGVTENDLERFRSALQQEREFLAATGEISELQTCAVNAIRNHKVFVDAEREKVEAPIREANRLFSIAKAANARLGEAQAKVNRLRQLYMAHWEFFGVPQPAAESTAGMVLQGALPPPQPEVRHENLGDCYPAVNRT